MQSGGPLPLNGLQAPGKPFRQPAVVRLITPADSWALDQPAQAQWRGPVRIEHCQSRLQPPDQQQSLPSC